MHEFLMPALGADMDAGKLVEWRVHPGDEVTRGQIVAVVETQKAAVEVETFSGGIVDRILVEPGEKVPVGTVLATLREPGEVAAAARFAAGSPAARRRMRELGLDEAQVRGSGPGGAIGLRDVERAAAGAGKPAEPVIQPEPAAELEELIPRPVPAPAVEEAQAGIRRAVAATMSRSKREIPHYYLGTTIDVSRALAFLDGENRRRPIGERLLFGVMLIKATALALREVPELNGHYIDGALRSSRAIHVGTAVSLRGGGVLAPALHDVDQKSLSQLMAEFQDLVGRARSGRLRSSEMSDPTVTVTSLGERGPEEVYGIIFPPQVALVGFGGIARRPWVVDGDALAVRPLVRATLCGDHRATDGHRGGLFLQALARRLAAPEEL